ncbi:NADH-quinone oxidoreductase subunit C [Paenibacillus sp. KN14-4R]|uniref:NADH-quinone oxidoreductase subunit C n=1 Tax=Paenibacillus sp. KN14-4R TaxID=3445773 RepID=UPI003F9FD048
MSDEQKRDETLTQAKVAAENKESTALDNTAANPIEAVSEAEDSKRSHNAEEHASNEGLTSEDGQPASTDKPSATESAPPAEPAAQSPAPAAEPGAAGASDVPAGDVEDAAAAKAAAAAAARAARDQARAAKAADAAAEAEAAPKAPSPNQPVLDRVVAILREQIDAEAVVEASINETDADAPVVVVHSDHWLRAAKLLRDHEELELTYLRNLSGVDHGTFMEVTYHLISLSKRIDYTFKVRTDRDTPSVPSVTPIWATANWNERETYDLFGIDFPGHPALTRIMLSDDWIGHPLRKDYEQYDPEV